MEEVTFNGPEQASPDIAREGEAGVGCRVCKVSISTARSSLTNLEGVSRRLLDCRMVADR